MYNNQYQYAHDIDWFFLNGDYPIHCASNGGLLPRSIYKAIELQSLQVAVEAMHPVQRVNLNTLAIERFVRHHYEGVSEGTLLGSDNPTFPEDIVFPPNIPLWMKAYSWSFIKMAQRGFFSFDRVERSNDYYLVAYPDYLSELSEDVNELIYKVPMDKCTLFHPQVIYAHPTDAFGFVRGIEWYERNKNENKEN